GGQGQNPIARDDTLFLRMKLYLHPTPHGVFKTDEFPDWHYLGTEITLPVFSPTMIQLLLWEPSV
ncbi:hypothetical protein SAMN05216280_107324, partial [Ectopseudomonas oleovorans]|uniref:hypothetical protein n=1 Tax=Ectopseudomonas oleovorans TaxID=301 RepID=UPI0008BEB8EB